MSAAIPTIDGPRLPPASGGKPEQLVVFLHGYGADGNDLIGLGRHWAKLLPDAAFVSPHAPEPCAMNPFGGRQWFALTFRDPSERWLGVQKAAPALHSFIDGELASLGLQHSQLALVGFSQGTMMALHAGLRRAKPLGAIVGFSGMLAGGEHLSRDLVSRPPVLLIHGDADEVIPVEALAQARELLAANQVPLEWHVRQGLGHGIDPEGLDIAGRFLRNALAAG